MRVCIVLGSVCNMRKRVCRVLWCNILETLCLQIFVFHLVPLLVFLYLELCFKKMAGPAIDQTICTT